ncbi:MAG: type II secretion system F family protein [Bradymonadia bacterium]
MSMTLSDPMTLATGASALATAGAVVFAVRAWMRGRQADAEQAELDAARAASDAQEAAREAAVARYGALAELMRPRTLAELSELKRRLARAGLRSEQAVELYSVARGISVLVGFVATAGLMLFSALSDLDLLLASLSLLCGYYLPEWWLKSRTTVRQEAIAEALPATLDLLVTCMEAGLGLEQALARVAREIAHSELEMAEELSIVVAEIRAGLAVPEVFRKLADRVTSDDMRNMCNVIGQASQLGASLGRSMREYAASARRRRSLGLEEVAGKVTAKLTLPLTLCLMPAALLVILGPAVVMIFDSLKGG